MRSRGVWRDKPSGQQRINLSHPLAQGILGYWLLPDRGYVIFDAANGNNGALLGSSPPTQKEFTLGWAQKFDGTAGVCYDLGLTQQYKPVLPVSLFAILNLDSVAVGSYIFASAISNGIGSNYSGFMLFNNAGPMAVQYGDNTGTGPTNRQTKVGATTISAGTTYSVGASIRGASDMSIYLNGVDDAGSYSGSGGTMVTANQSAGIGRIHGDASGVGTLSSITGSVQIVILWSRSLSEAEHKQLALDPYGLFSVRQLRARRAPRNGSAAVHETATITTAGRISAKANSASVIVVDAVTTSGRLVARTSSAVHETVTVTTDGHDPALRLIPTPITGTLTLTPKTSGGLVLTPAPPGSLPLNPD